MCVDKIKGRKLGLRFLCFSFGWAGEGRRKKKKTKTKVEEA